MFVEEHAKSVLNLEVIASAQREGDRLFNIDILSVDMLGRPFIIECKWDLVDRRATATINEVQSIAVGWLDSFRETSEQGQR